MHEYPSFRWIESRGIIPDIPLPQDFRTRVPDFYKANGKERVTTYAENLCKNMSGIFTDNFEPRMQWDEKRGLKKISVTPSSGLDLNNYDEFQEHNLGGVASLVTGAIAMRYVELLLEPEKR